MRKYQDAVRKEYEDKIIKTREELENKYRWKYHRKNDSYKIEILHRDKEKIQKMLKNKYIHNRDIARLYWCSIQTVIRAKEMWRKDLASIDNTNEWKKSGYSKTIRERE